MRWMLCIGVYLAGCLNPPAVEDASPIVVLAVQPEGPIEPQTPIEIVFSGSVEPPSSGWPIAIKTEDGTSVAHDIEVLSPEVISLRPKPYWPSTQVWIELGQGLQGAPSVEPPSAPMLVVVEQPTVPPMAALLSPAPSSLSPANLRYVTVSRGLQSAEFYLEGPQTITTRPLALDEQGRALLALEGELSPGATYSLRTRSSELLLAEGASSLIRTSTVFDDQAPTVLTTKVHFEGGTAIVEVCADEPVLLQGRAESGGGGAGRALIPALIPSERALGRFTGLQPDQDYKFWVEVFDPSGQHAAPLEIPVRTAAAMAVRISEVVPQPLHDWGDSAPVGLPFDSAPGTGAVSSADEWVELVNMGSAPIDLTRAGLQLRVLDASPVEQPLSSAPGMFFGAGGNLQNWWPGEALVIRPRGDMATRALTLELRWGNQVLDRVHFGDGADSVHPGGAPPDLEHEARARDVLGRWAWCAPTPGDPRPTRDCR